MPEDIRDNYQYFTQAEMFKVRSAGYETPFWDFSESVKDYVQGYLMQKEAKKSYL
jgi:ADP-L-glycero-D-manno-heptose 6-epimerase